MAYIDIKQTVWVRYVISEKEIKKLSHLSEKSVWDMIHSNSESEWLYDTSEYIKPKDNNDQATIEVYSESKRLEKKMDHDELIWTNRDKSIVRQEKIDQALN